MNQQSDLRRAAFGTKLRLFNPRAHSSFRHLMEAQELSRERLASLNWERRKSLVEHCAHNIPFYIAKFREIGFESGDLKSEQDWARLPILEKSDIRSHAETIVCPKYRLSKLPTATTGGTTGSPLMTYNDPTVHLTCMSWRMLGWWELHPSDNSGYLYRAIPTGSRRKLGAIALFPTRRTYMSASQMTRENLREFLDTLRSIKPTYLVGYVGALEAFARYCDEVGFKLPTLQAIWTTASPLSQSCRSYLEDVFKCPAYTQYGSCELYWIAAECKKKCGLHIGTDVRHVEVIDAASDHGTFGDLVVTDLLNYAFPLLRYRIGDRGRLKTGECSCGLPFPLMDYVRGRVTDSIRLSNGMVIPGEYWTTIFDDFTETIAAFQVHQKADLSIEVRYVKKAQAEGGRVADLVLRRLTSQTGGQTSITLLEVDEIPHRQGKRQFVICDAL